MRKKKSLIKKIGNNREENREYVNTIKEVEFVMRRCIGDDLDPGFTFIKKISPVLVRDDGGIAHNEGQPFEPTAEDPSKWCYEVIWVRRW